MNQCATYTAVYRKGNSLPAALFLDEQDAREWHDNPALFEQCRRRVIISPKPLGPQMETEAEQLLRAIVTPENEHFGDEIERAQKLLGIFPAVITTNQKDKNAKS